MGSLWLRVSASSVRSSRLRVAWVTLAIASAAGCPLPDPNRGVLGEQQTAYFSSDDTDLVFTQVLVVGSRFQVSVQPVRPEDASILSGTLRVSSSGVLAILTEPEPGHAILEAVGPGEAYLELVTDDAIADRILLRAARPRSLELGDGSLQGATIDPRLPSTFGLAEPTPMFLIGLDRCGGALLPVGAFELSAPDGGVLDVERGGANDWVVTPSGTGEGELTVSRASGEEQEEWVTYRVDAVTSAGLTGIVPRISAVDENSAQVWARAYAGPVEVVGLEYTWLSQGDVVLRDDVGAFNVATLVASEADAGTADDPALVEMRYGQASASIDLYAATTNDLETARVPPPEVAEPDPAASSGGCSAPECNPYLAGLLGAFALRRIRRSRLMETP